MSETKQCITCKRHLPMSSFHSKGVGRKRTECAPCYKLHGYKRNPRTKYQSDWRKSNPESAGRLTTPPRTLKELQEKWQHRGVRTGDSGGQGWLNGQRECADELTPFVEREAAEVPLAYVCPANCGCMWRDNKDGTMSLFGKRSQSCEVCEPLPLSALIPVFISQIWWVRDRETQGEAKLSSRPGREPSSSGLSGNANAGSESAHIGRQADSPLSPEQPTVRKVIDTSIVSVHSGQTFKCRARSANVGGNDPQDCNWPTCGCDPYADKVISTLQESGLLATDRDSKLRGLVEAAQEVYKLIEDGVLVRDTSHDSEPGWALKQIPLVRTLAKFKEALAAALGRQG